MKLCGFEAGLDRPFFLIAGAAGAQSRGQRSAGMRPRRLSLGPAGGVGMKLCGFEAGLDQPFFLIAGAAGAQSRGPALRGCDRAGCRWARREELA
jgi:4-diphosphocytidyl-2C-methyl-D-erythritol kinase